MIVVRRRVADSGEEVIGGVADEDNQWQGFVKQMKIHFAKETGLINRKFKIQREAMEKIEAEV